MKVFVAQNPLELDYAEYQDDAKESILSVVVERYYTANLPCEVRVNGQSIEPELLSITPVYTTDTVVIRPRVNGYFLVPLMMQIFSDTGMAVKAAMFIGSMITKFTVVLVGGLIVGALTGKPKQPDASGAQGGNFWDQHTVQQEGMAIPRCYGRNLLTGNIIAAWGTSNDAVHSVDPEYTWYWTGTTDYTYGKKDLLNLIIGLGRGPVKGIVTDSIKINDQSVSNFSEISYEERLGTLDQAAFTGMTDLRAEHRVSIRIKATDAPTKTYTMPVTDMDDIEITFCLPKGLKRVSNGVGKHCHWGMEVSIKEAGGAYSVLAHEEIVATSFKPF
jgi:hypothetical protein